MKNLKILPALTLCLYASLSASEQSLALFEKTTQAVIQQEAQRLTKVLEHDDTQHWYRHILPVFHKLEKSVSEHQELAQLVEQSKKNTKLHEKLFYGIHRSLYNIDEQLKLVPNINIWGCKSGSTSYPCADAMEAFSTFKEEEDQKELPLLGQIAHDLILLRDLQKLAVKTLHDEYLNTVAPELKQIQEDAPSLVLCATHLYKKDTSLVDLIHLIVHRRAMDDIFYASIKENCISQNTDEEIKERLTALMKKDYTQISNLIEEHLNFHQNAYFEHIFNGFLKQTKPLPKKFTDTVKESIHLLTQAGDRHDRLDILKNYVARDISDIAIPTEGRLEKKTLANYLFNLKTMKMAQELYRAIKYVFENHIDNPQAAREPSSAILQHQALKKFTDKRITQEEKKSAAILIAQDNMLDPTNILDQKPTKKDNLHIEICTNAARLRSLYCNIIFQHFGPLLEKLHKYAPIEKENGRATFLSQELDEISDATRITELMKKSCQKTLEEFGKGNGDLDFGLKKLDQKLQLCIKMGDQHPNEMLKHFGIRLGLLKIHADAQQKLRRASQTRSQQ